MADTAQDRKLPATERRIEKARTEGQVARSRDLSHFTALGLAVALLALLAELFTQRSTSLLRSGFVFNQQALLDPGSAMLGALGSLGAQALWILLPLSGAVLLVALLSGWICGGWNFTLEPLQPKFSKINPISGLGRVFSLQSLTETLKSCLLAVLMGVVAGIYLRQHWMQHAELLAMPLPAALAAAGKIVLGGLLWIIAVLATFALVDVPLQRQMLLRRLRMSQEEVRQEFKEVEGSPQIKAKLRQRMREMANRRMMAAVPEADLVVMNPSHYAVALKYDEAKMSAPRVVAKGADQVAIRIRDLALQSKVPVLQAPPLARALYAHCELDQEVPARLFSAVAQVLAWVYQLRDAMAKGRPADLPMPMPEVPADLDPANPAALLAAHSRRAANAPDYGAAP